MENNLLYWVWLTDICGVYNNDINALLEQFDTVDEIYKATDYSGVSNVKPLTLKKLRDKSLKRAEKIKEDCEKIGAQIITFDDIRYPDSLRVISNPPYVLYMRGEIMKWDRILGIGVVGTRNCSDYGHKATGFIVKDLALCGATIISGMAAGIDGLAARAALDSGNKTIAVLGTAIDNPYPWENRGLMQKIIENGTVISEYPPGAKTQRTSFPWRNRIISGLSKGVLVIEAPEKSGALITASYALEQGKDIFAVPGNIFKKESTGTNNLLSNGAKAVGSATDILSEYVYEIERLNIKKPTAISKIFSKSEKIDNEIKLSIDDKRFSGLSDSDKKIISLLIDENMHIDDIARKSEIPMGELTTKLAMLEFSGHIQKIPGNNYKLNI
ncbi:MAG: DNA-processing protein DprA [Clostridia bacterium]|nr:DNA-processing protein DprA [Clostridia bacterium]